MSAINNESKETVTTPESQGVPSVTAARRRRRILVNILRVLLLIVIIGGWELATRARIIDPFTWGRPSGIWQQLVTWATQGPAKSTRCQQLACTFKGPITR